MFPPSTYNDQLSYQSNSVFVKTKVVLLHLHLTFAILDLSSVLFDLHLLRMQYS